MLLPSVGGYFTNEKCVSGIGLEWYGRYLYIFLFSKYNSNLIPLRHLLLLE